MNIRNKDKLALQLIRNDSKNIKFNKNLLNLKPARLAKRSNNLWDNEIEEIEAVVKTNHWALPELVIQAVMKKMQLVGSEKEEIENFLRFYLETDPLLMKDL